MTVLAWTDADHDAANSEGWDLFDCDGSENGPVQLCKIDDPEAWAEDRGVTITQTWQADNEAWVYVWTNPSDLHTKALAMVKAENPVEYEAIEQWVNNNEAKGT
jgi:hypothetical protein